MTDLRSADVLGVVDVQHLPTNEVGIGRREEYIRGPELGRKSRTSVKGRAYTETLHVLRWAGGRLESSDYRTRRNAIDTDALGCELLSKSTGKADDGAFCRAIVDERWRAFVCGDRCGVDD